jgi:hypothetical protein
MQKPSRPAGVTILAAVQILIGILGLLVGIAIIGLSALVSSLPAIGSLAGTLGLLVGGITLLFSIVWLATGIGFLHGRAWARTLGIVFGLLAVFISIGVLAIGLVLYAVVGVFFWTLLLHYLTRPHVKVFFGKSGLPENLPNPMAYVPLASINQPPAITNIPSYSQAPAPSASAMPMLQSVGSSTPPSQPATGPNPSLSSGIGPKAQVSCPYCHSPLTNGSPKCLTCGATI